MKFDPVEVSTSEVRKLAPANHLSAVLEQFERQGQFTFSPVEILEYCGLDSVFWVTKAVESEPSALKHLRIFLLCDNTEIAAKVATLTEGKTKKLLTDSQMADLCYLHMPASRYQSEKACLWHALLAYSLHDVHSLASCLRTWANFKAKADNASDVFDTEVQRQRRAARKYLSANPKTEEIKWL